MLEINQLGMNIVTVASVLFAVGTMWLASYVKKHHKLPF
ncbi:MAG: hypothetical protein RL154_1281 [Pseudomonadota bacterium]|jgi:hypothetical protein